MSLIRCPDCREKFDESWEALQHDCDADRPAVHDNHAPDGGVSLDLDGEMKLLVTYTSGGIAFTSGPLPHDMATEYANALAEATVTVDGQQRPLCDDKNVTLEPVEVDDGE